MEIEAYLQSDQAVADVAAMLAEPWDLSSDFVPARRGAWTRISLRDGVPVYFRPAAYDLPVNREPLPESLRPNPATPPTYITVPALQRFIVTDLGEAVRALRLRTGYTGLADDLPYDEVPGAPMLCDGRLIGVAGPREDDRISTADLPRAICAVLLAAHRVATLTAP